MFNSMDTCLPFFTQLLIQMFKCCPHLQSTSDSCHHKYTQLQKYVVKKKTIRLGNMFGEIFASFIRAVTRVLSGHVSRRPARDASYVGSHVLDKLVICSCKSWAGRLCCYKASLQMPKSGFPN